jgi:magnesium-transporting ATPase (P-type)
MYVTVEMINFFFLWLVYVDLKMYDDRSDTRAVARSTNVTDLGQVQYIFSDKTGTLTANVMRFKRCSVDGMVFGSPIQKARPGANTDDDYRTASAFHPLRQLLVGKIDGDGLAAPVTVNNKMTFNAEMFLRVMSLCHTVVVEKDLDLSNDIDESKSVSSVGSSWSAAAKSYTKKFFSGKRDRTISDMSASSAHGQISTLETVAEDPGMTKIDNSSIAPRSRAASTGSVGITTQFTSPFEKSPDGAPAGFAYQAESPDEGALVSEASKTFGFQVIGRDSSGIKIRVDRPTVFSDESLVAGLKSGALNPKRLAADTATGQIIIESDPQKDAKLKDENGLRTETWSILAVNKFDSDRKRMSILLRAPPELGSVAVLFCKGADSAMLDPSVCSASQTVFSGNEMTDAERSQQLEVVSEDAETEWETAQMLGMQSHLGEFATEGLRTLVLGVRFLTETDCAEWLELHKQAATSIKDRDEKLKAAALSIETNIHIVGATAIEDKLQDGVPDTIATLEKAGIKLWVLTGDKRETAIEIGYSTQVLTPKMHLTEMADRGEEFVRAQCAMEFMRMVKAGKLPLYQRAAVDQSDDSWSMENFMYALGKYKRSISRTLRGVLIRSRLFFQTLARLDTTDFQEALESIKHEKEAENEILKDNVRRRNVRNRAEKIIRDYMTAHGHEVVEHETTPVSPASDHEASELSTDDLPAVFNRAQSARSLLEKRGSQRLSQSDKRSRQLAQLTAQEAGTHKDQPMIEEDMLSLASFRPATGDVGSEFDRKRRTVLERVFAVDRDVRKGRLVKHLTKEKRDELKSGARSDHRQHHEISPSGEGPRALVVEGAALKHLLGDLELEELIFNIASQCDAVIACRVSPRQKALLVKLVRQRVVPEPVTLAIGDGANDVGMIQEAHVGIGISGKEGKQAVNASDFAIAQFRFLESLVLIHGRWDFMRLSVVVLFSFYKNACMAGCLIVYNAETLYSGTPLFDEWVIAVLNFVAGIPILLLGMFDRCLEKDYILRHPEVYKPARDNELITMRVLFRWVVLAFAHIFILYYGSLPQLTGPGGMTSAFSGLMWDKEVVGNGEGGDLQSVGTVIFTSMIILLAYKVLYESRSIINGRWPAIACRKNAKDGTGCAGFWNRLPYTWYGVTYGSIIFFFLFLFIYQRIGKKGPGEYFNLVGVPNHIFGTRSINYLSILFVPIAGMTVDIAGKVFSNMFYPTQTQIHIELEAKEFAQQKAEARERNKGMRTAVGTTSLPNTTTRVSADV